MRSLALIVPKIMNVPVLVLILLMPTMAGCRQQECEITCKDGYNETTDGSCGVLDAMRAISLGNQRRTSCSTENSD
jgi:hypothetical protein